MERVVTITYLEMTSREQVVAYDGQRRLHVRRIDPPEPELNRSLYVGVGAEWSWYERLSWNQERWMLWLDRPEVETWVGYLDRVPAGYFELEAQPGGHAQIMYFGLMPAFIGRGLGPELLAAAVARAWQIANTRVWVHTCTLDHPRALANYQARGFRVYDTEEKIEQVPDVDPTHRPSHPRT